MGKNEIHGHEVMRWFGWSKVCRQGTPREKSRWRRLSRAVNAQLKRLHLVQCQPLNDSEKENGTINAVYWENTNDFMRV